MSCLRARAIFSSFMLSARETKSEIDLFFNSDKFMLMGLVNYATELIVLNLIRMSVRERLNREKWVIRKKLVIKLALTDRGVHIFKAFPTQFQRETVPGFTLPAGSVFIALDLRVNKLF
ncbi:hypothetical protein NFHSH190041_04120 [Shewanella sp. NFH-SH190041]|nr:hypothetical protein NFHSH190041_04120 [Shewanella sp. NFH-SH190041]